ncbi:hypothetical protein L9F63_022650, partial [Diploptera punctata]
LCLKKTWKYEFGMNFTHIFNFGMLPIVYPLQKAVCDDLTSPHIFVILRTSFERNFPFETSLEFYNNMRKFLRYGIVNTENNDLEVLEKSLNVKQYVNNYMYFYVKK